MSTHSARVSSKGIIPVREFSCVSEMMAHRREVRAKFFSPRPPVTPSPAPEPPKAIERDILILTEVNAMPAFQSYRSALSIKREIAEKHGFTVADLDGPRRHVPLVAARMEAMAAVYVARPDWSLPRIGKFFGGRDHTTVLHSIRKMGVWRS